MRIRVMLPAMVAVGLLTLVATPKAPAFNLLNRALGGGAAQKGAAQKGCDGAAQKGCNGAAQKGDKGASQKGCNGVAQKGCDGGKDGKGATQKGCCEPRMGLLARMKARRACCEGDAKGATQKCNGAAQKGCNGAAQKGGKDAAQKGCNGAAQKK